MAKHIVTLEDPIEFLFKDKQSIISQREIRVDTDSFQNALEYIMLQTPDIIFIGDIRKAEVMSTALTAAETEKGGIGKSGAGFDEVVSKPISKNTFYEVVGKYLGLP